MSMLSSDDPPTVIQGVREITKLVEPADESINEEQWHSLWSAVGFAIGSSTPTTSKDHECALQELSALLNVMTSSLFIHADPVAPPPLAIMTNVLDQIEPIFREYLATSSPLRKKEAMSPDEERTKRKFGTLRSLIDSFGWMSTCGPAVRSRMWVVGSTIQITERLLQEQLVSGESNTSEEVENCWRICANACFMGDGPSFTTVFQNMGISDVTPWLAYPMHILDNFDALRILFTLFSNRSLRRGNPIGASLAMIYHQCAQFYRIYCSEALFERVAVPLIRGGSHRSHFAPSPSHRWYQVKPMKM
jgi:hypothetical protein